MKLFATFLVGLLLGLGAPAFTRIEQTDAKLSAAAFFTDIQGTEYFDEDGSVWEMVAKGIINGYDDGRFGGGDVVTRGQAVVMLTRYHHNVVQPLQRKVDYLLKHLDLGECGNGQTDVSEQCDDGNTLDGDGCSAECLQERQPKPPIAGMPQCREGFVLKPVACTNSIPPHCTFECVQKEIKQHCAGGHKIGESFPADDGCNTCFCGENGIIGCTKMACIPTCDPYVCADGSKHPRCSDDGHIINYIVDPCFMQGAECGNGTCEQGEADISNTGGCGPNADSRCLGPPAYFKEGTCPEDCKKEGLPAAGKSP